MPLLPSALPPKGEARHYVANDFLNLIALPCRERCSGHLTAWRTSYLVNEADRIGGVVGRNWDPYKQDGGLQRGDTHNSPYARNCKKHLAYFSHVVYNTFI